MYEITTHRIPEGCKINDYARELVRKIKNGEDVEQSKDILFRSTYLMALPELKKYSYIGEPEELISDMSVAFMKTIDHFDPDKPGASFVNYYRRCINTEIVQNYYGKFKNKSEWREDYRYFLNGTRSIDEQLYDKNGVESDTLAATIKDENFDMEDEINRIAMADVLRRALDEMYNSNKYLKQEGKVMFEYFIECCIAGKDVNQIEIAREFDTCRGNVSMIFNRYKRKIAEILRREGYQI